MREGVRKPHGDRGSDRQDRPPLRHRGVRPAELQDQCGPESSDRQAVRPAKLIDADQVVRGYVGEVVISCGSEVIARHPRSYRRDDFVFDPVHYLPLLERKTGALDQAAPLVALAAGSGAASLDTLGAGLTRVSRPPDRGRADRRRRPA